jgi:hypothetical protein
LLTLEPEGGHAEKLRQELADLIAEQKAVEACLAVFQSLKGNCPTCGQALCEVVKAKELGRLQKRVADLEARVQGAREELNDLDGIEAASSRLQDHRRALVRRARLEEEQSKLQTAHRPDVGNLDGRLSILVERINKGEWVLEKAQQFETAEERWEAYIRDKSILEERTGRLDKLSEFFAPGGALMSQTSGRMESLAEDLNRHLADFGYMCNLALDPFVVRVGCSSDIHHTLPLMSLSESEQFRFGVSFQLALALVRGLRFAVLDRADLLYWCPIVDWGTFRFRRHCTPGFTQDSGLQFQPALP